MTFSTSSGMAARSLFTSQRQPGIYIDRGGFRTDLWLRDLALAETPYSTTNREVSEARARVDEQSRYDLQRTEGQYRDLYIGTGTGGEFAPPEPMRELFVASRSNGDVVGRHLCTRFALPDEGRTVTIPRMDSSGSVAPQTHADPLPTLAEVDMSFSDQTASIVEFGGVQDLSLFLYERSNPSAGDLLIKNLANELVAAKDNELLNGTDTATSLDGLLTSASHALTCSTEDILVLQATIMDAVSRIAVSSQQTGLLTALIHPRRYWTWTSETPGNSDNGIRLAKYEDDTWNGAEPAVITLIRNPEPGGHVAYLTRYPLVRFALTNSMPTNVSSTQDALVIGHQASAYLFEGPVLLEVDFGNHFKASGVTLRARQYVANIATNAANGEAAKITGAAFAAPTFTG